MAVRRKRQGKRQKKRRSGNCRLGENRAFLRYPGYYKEFSCSGSQCTDTCCAGWGITVDPKTLRSYLAMPGEIGDRLRESLDRKTGCFHMREGRCPFLNRENLCDLILEQGDGALCHTCRRYPRHMEVYGPLRELSLSLSCPEAAKLILCGDERERMLTVRTLTSRMLAVRTFAGEKISGRPEPENCVGDDGKLLSRLLFVRQGMLEILSDRSLPIEHRMALILALGYDSQKRLDRGRLGALTDVTNRYRTRKDGKLAGCLRPYTGQKEKRRNLMCLCLELAGRLEPVIPKWKRWMDDTARRLYGAGTDETLYAGIEENIRENYKAWELDMEHLMNYFLRGYVLGAFYDGELEAKVRLAVVSCLIIRELGMGIYEEKGYFGREEQIAAAHWFSRELEHSDYNLEKWERIVSRHPALGIRQLLIGILS